MSRVMSMKLMLWAAIAIGTVAAVGGQGLLPCVHEARFGVTGLARLQTARLNVVNVQPPDPAAPPDPVHPPDPIYPPEPCRVAIGFLNTSNQLFVNGAGQPIVLALELRPGQSAFVELNSVDAFRGSLQLRVPFRASGLFTHRLPQFPPDPCRDIIASLEVYDAVIGRSQVIANPAEIFAFDWQPEPSHPLAGLLRD
jgi:hypothetical protein